MAFTYIIESHYTWLLLLSHLGAVVFHLALVTFLVFSGLIFPDFLLLGRERLEASRDETSYIAEGRIRVFLLDRGTNVDRIQKVSRHVTLGCVGILLLLLLAAALRGVLGRDIVLHLASVTGLFSFSLLFPLAELLVGEFLVLTSKDTSLFVP